MTTQWPLAIYYTEDIRERKEKEDDEGNLDYVHYLIYRSEFPQLLNEVSIGSAYRRFQEEYGRCTGHVHQDSDDAMAIGWVFEKRVPYDDTPKETYLREVWITMYYRIDKLGHPYTTIEAQHLPERATRTWKTESSTYHMPTFREINVKEKK